MTLTEEESIEQLDDLLEDFDADEFIPSAIIVPAPQVLRRDKHIVIHNPDENYSDDPDYEDSFTFGSKSKTKKGGKNSKSGGLGEKCGQCNLVLNSKQELRFHINTTHKPRLDHECDRCGASFHRIANLRRHFKTVHENQRDFKCGHCNRLFGEKQTLQRHIRDIHNAKQATEIDFERVDDVEDENGEGAVFLISQIFFKKMIFKFFFEIIRNFFFKLFFRSFCPGLCKTRRSWSKKKIHSGRIYEQISWKTRANSKNTNSCFSRY